MPVGGPIRALLAVLLLLAAAVGVSAGGEAAGGAAAASEREGLRRGVMGNGLVYVVVPHASASGSGARVAVTVRIDSGSLSERDDERGAARAAEVIARDAVIAAARERPGLAAAGVRPEQDLRSSAQYESTTLTLGVPATDPLVVSAAMESLAAALTFEPATPAALDRAAAISGAQDRSAASPGLRLNRELLPRLLEGTLFATRMPWAVEPGALSALALDAFRTRSYSAANAGVIVAGDGLPVAALEAMTREVFGRLKGGARPPEPRVGDVETARQIALVGSDAGVAGDFVQFSRTLKPATGPGAALDALLLDVGCEAIAGRLDEAQRSGECPGVWSRAMSSTLSRSLGLVAILVGGDRGSALELAGCLVESARGLAARPLTDAEVKDAAQRTLARYRREADEEAKASPEVVAERFAETLGNRRALGGARERAADAEKAIFTLAAPAVTARMIDALDPGRAALVAVTPENGARPTEAVLLAALNAEVPGAERAKQIAIAGAEPVTRAPAHADAAAPPQRGVSALAPLSAKDALRAPAGDRSASATRLALDPWSGVAGAALPSGVRVLARAVPVGANASPRVTVAAAFSFGQGDDPADARGLAAALAAALREPALEGVAPADLRRELASRGVSWEARPSPDAVTLLVTAPADSLDAALGLVRAIRERGTLDAQTLRRLSSRLRMAAEQADTAPDLAVSRLYYASAFPDERRMAPLSREEAASLGEAGTIDRVHGLLRSAPLTVAAAGAIEPREAVARMTAALGDLPASPAPSRRDVRVQPGAEKITAEARIPTPDEKSLVAEGWVLSGSRDAASVLALEVGAEWLTGVLTARLRDELGLTAAVRVECRPDTGWSGAGEFWAMVSCAPGREDEAARELRAALSRLVEAGPSGSDVEALRQRVAARRAEALADGAWWAERLTLSVLRGVDPAADTGAPAVALRLTAEEVRRAAAKAAGEGRPVSLRVTPR